MWVKFVKEENLDQYSAKDIVIPLPGFAVYYPSNGERWWQTVDRATLRPGATPSSLTIPVQWRRFLKSGCSRMA